MQPRMCRSLLALAVGCTTLAAQTLPASLVDVADDPLALDGCGIDFTYAEVGRLGLEPPAQMGGMACADYDNDGWIDVFLPGNLGQPSKLYRNQGDGTFLDVASECGVIATDTATSAAIFVDYDNDGDLDLLLAGHAGETGTAIGPLFRLFRNAGAAGGYLFQDVSVVADFSLAPTVAPTNWGWQGGLAVGDYNKDGFPDFFSPWWGACCDGNMWRLFRSAPNPAPGDPEDPTYTPRIFVDATIESGLDFMFGGEPWQSIFMDVNHDSLPDLHVNIDFDRDFMFVNNGDGTFTNQIGDYHLNGSPPESRNEMGCALGDVDNDGDFDLHVTNLFEADRFYRCDASPLGDEYADKAIETGLDDSAWGWGDTFFDFDNDGDLDHATVSGWKFPTVVPYFNNVHINLYPQKLVDGVTVAWQDATYLLPEFSKTLTEFGDLARGLAPLDYDNDGDIDLIVTRKKAPTALYKNTLSGPNHWMGVDLVEAGGSLNTVGATVWLKTWDRQQVRQILAGNSFQSQEPPRLHFGLGPTDPTSKPAGRAAGKPFQVIKGTVPGPGSSPVGGPGTPSLHPDWLVVRWFDGGYQIVKSPGVDAALTVARGAVNDAGDMDADGHLTPTDESMLLLAISNPGNFVVAYPKSPGLIVGDIDGNGYVDAADHTLWAQLPPH